MKASELGSGCWFPRNWCFFGVLNSKSIERCTAPRPTPGLPSAVGSEPYYQRAESRALDDAHEVTIDLIAPHFWLQVATPIDTYCEGRAPWIPLVLGRQVYRRELTLLCKWGTDPARIQGENIKKLISTRSARWCMFHISGPCTGPNMDYLDG
jgi:hypothetical protein